MQITPEMLLNLCDQMIVQSKQMKQLMQSEMMQNYLDGQMTAWLTMRSWVVSVVAQ